MGEILDAILMRTSLITEALGRLNHGSLTAASELPGWSRLTIACHLRFGARALDSMTAGTLQGRPVAYYPEGRARQRAGTLVPDPGETPSEVVASLSRYSDALQERWSGLGPRAWELTVTEPSDNRDLGALSLSGLALLRLTEVEVHGSDLALGLADWSDTFVSTALPFRLDRLNRLRPDTRRTEDSIHGSWLLIATEGLSYLVSVSGGQVTSYPAGSSSAATAVISASSRDLLALLLGRPFRRQPRISGDETFARAFKEVFPGP